jgi:homoserine/homoserine lactone efflux protein
LSPLSQEAGVSQAIERHACRAERAGGWFPQVVGKAGDAFDREPVRREEGQRRVAQDEQRADGDRARAQRREGSEGRARRRSGVDGIVDDSDCPTVQMIMKSVGDSVGHALCLHPALGEGEAQVQFGCDHLGDEGATDQWANHGLDAMSADPPRELAREGQQGGWPQEQRIEVEPQIAMMARLQDEVSAPGREKTENLLFHTTENLGMFPPMSLELYAAYLVACLIVVLVPGPTVTLILANSIRHGTRAGLLNVLGTQLGLAMMIGVVGLGLTSLMEAAGHWFDWLRLAGAAYLIWLGFKMIRSSGADGEGTTPAPPRGGFLTQGVLVALSNPKTLIFFGAFFPQFIDPARDHGLQILIMGLTAMLVAALSDSAYALAAGRAGRAQSVRRIRLLSRVSGGFLIGGGLWLAFSRR